MKEVVYRGRVIARSDRAVVIDGELTFPFAAICSELLRSSSKTSFDPNRGIAEFFDLELDGVIVSDAAWAWQGMDADTGIPLRRVAFWPGVEIH